MLEFLQKFTLLLLSIIVSFFLFLKVDIVNKGGPVMIAMIICSIFAMSIITERFWLLFRMRIDVNRFLEVILDLLKRRQVKEAIDLCDKSPHPVALILKNGIIKSGYGRDKIKEAMEDASSYEVPKMEKNLSLLATLAHVTPLLGLLGTVLGLLRCFQVIQAKSAAFISISPADISGGMWEALISTIMGLAIAIPTYVAYNYFVNRINTFVLEMEHSATELLNFLTERSEPGI